MLWIDFLITMWTGEYLSKFYSAYYVNIKSLLIGTTLVSK